MINLLKRNNFNLFYWALLLDSQFKTFKGKLTTRCLGPYEVVTMYDNGAVKIKTIDDGQVIQVDIGGRPPFLAGSKQLYQF
jgi:hypothetical protein